jgi:hypothetical protein
VIARRAAPVITCVAVFYAIFVPLRLVQHDALWFVHTGRAFGTAAHTSPYLSGLRRDAAVGYDGEFYFAVAADPTHAKDYLPGRAGIVYSRVGYPALAYVLSGGSRTLLPAVMLAINLAAVFVATGAIALWLIRRGLSPWPAAFYGLFPGVIFSAFFDLTEPLAYALVAVAVLVLETRPWVAALLFAGAVLTRETTVPFALAAAVAVAVARHAWRRGVVFAAATCAPLLLWRIFMQTYTHEATQETGHGADWLVPFRGFWPGYPFDSEHRLIFFTVVAPGVVAAIGGILLLRQGRARLPAALLLVNVLLYLVFLPRGPYIDYPAASRSVIGILVAALYCLPWWWRPQWSARLVLAGEAVGLSLPWYLLVAWKYSLATFNAITS